MKETITNFDSESFDEKQMVKYGKYQMDKETLKILSGFPSVVFSLRNKPVIIYGMLPLREKEAHLWMIPTPEFYKNKTSAIRHIKKVLGNLKHTHNIHKAVTQSNSGQGQARWLKYLGFHRDNSNKYIRML